MTVGVVRALYWPSHLQPVNDYNLFSLIHNLREPIRRAVFRAAPYARNRVRKMADGKFYELYRGTR